MLGDVHPQGRTIAELVDYEDSHPTYSDLHALNFPSLSLKGNIWCIREPLLAATSVGL